MRIKWTDTEDNLLARTLESQTGSFQWQTIAQILNDQGVQKSAKQIRSRWHYNLTPGLNKNKWSHSDSMRLLESYTHYGCKWKKITKDYPGRTDNAIKNHFFSLMRKALRMAAKNSHDRLDISSTKLINRIKPKVLATVLFEKMDDIGVRYTLNEKPDLLEFINTYLQIGKDSLKTQISEKDKNTFKECLNRLLVLNKEYSDKGWVRLKSRKIRKKSVAFTSQPSELNISVKANQYQMEDSRVNTDYGFDTPNPQEYYQKSISDKTSGMRSNDEMNLRSDPNTSMEQVFQKIEKKIGHNETLVFKFKSMFKNYIESISESLNLPITDKGQFAQYIDSVLDEIANMSNQIRMVVENSETIDESTLNTIYHFLNHKTLLGKTVNCYQQNLLNQSMDSFLIDPPKNNATAFQAPIITEKRQGASNLLTNSITTQKNNQRHINYQRVIKNAKVQGYKKNLNCNKGLSDVTNYVENFKLNRSICLVDDQEPDNALQSEHERTILRNILDSNVGDTGAHSEINSNLLFAKNQSPDAGYSYEIQFHKNSIN